MTSHFSHEDVRTVKFDSNEYDKHVTVAYIKSAPAYPSCFHINNTWRGSLFCFHNEELNSCWISGLFSLESPQRIRPLLCRVSKLKLYCVINKLLETHLSIEQCVILIGHIKGALLRAHARNGLRDAVLRPTLACHLAFTLICAWSGILQGLFSKDVCVAVIGLCFLNIFNRGELCAFNENELTHNVFVEVSH